MRTSFKQLSLAVACVLSGGSVYAAGMMDALAPDHAPSMVGLAVGVAPDYLGSDEDMVGIAPMARYQFKDSNRYVILLANEMDINLIDSATWRAGPVLNYSFGRDDVDDNVVDRMDEVEGFLEYGAFVQYLSADPQNPRNRWSIGVTGLMNSQDDNEGYRVRLGAQVFRQVSKAVDINFGGGMWYADGDWNDYYFGVNADNVGTSGLSFFEADSGVNQYFVNASAIVYFSKNWAMATGVRYANISGDAGDSPLVKDRGDEDQWIAGVGLTYMIW